MKANSQRIAIGLLAAMLAGCFGDEEWQALQAAEAIGDPWQRYLAIRQLDDGVWQEFRDRLEVAQRQAYGKAIAQSNPEALAHLCAREPHVWDMDRHLIDAWERACPTLPSERLRQLLVVGETHAALKKHTPSS